MKKLYILMISLFIGNIANAQIWLPLGPEDLKQSSFWKADYTSISLDSNNIPYIVYKDWDYMGKATVKKFNGSAWEIIGNAGFSIGVADYTSIAISKNGILYVAYSDEGNGYKVTVKKFNGNSWVNLGNTSISNGYCEYVSIAIDSSNNPIIVYQDYNNNRKAVVKKFDGISWVNVGSYGVSSGRAEHTNICIDVNNNPYIIYGDSINGNKATVKKYNGSSWIDVGNVGFSQGSAIFLSIKVNKAGIPYVIYSDGGLGNKAIVQKFTGNTWQDISNGGLTSGIANYTSLTTDKNDSIYVFYSDYLNNRKAIVKKLNGSVWDDLTISMPANEKSFDNAIVIDSLGNVFIIFHNQSKAGKAVVKKYNGNNWSILGSTGISIGATENCKIGIDKSGIPYIAYNDYENNYYKASVKKYIGNAWVNVGNEGFSAGETREISIAMDNSNIPYVLYKDVANGNKATVMKFNDTSWVSVGNAGFSSGQINFPSIVIDSVGIPYVAFSDATYGNKATVMKFNGNSWVVVGSAGFTSNYASQPKLSLDNTGVLYIAYSDFYNGGKANVRKFNGSSWISVGSAGFSTLGAYNPDITFSKTNVPYVVFSDGAFNYKATVMKYNDTSWLNVGNAGFSTDQAKYTTLVLDDSNNVFVAYADNDKEGRLTIKKYNGNSWFDSGYAGLSAGEAISIGMVIDTNNKPIIVYSSIDVWVCKLSSFRNPTNGGSISGNQTICKGVPPSALSNTSIPTAYVGTLEYKWQCSIISDSSDFVDIAMSDSLNYTPINMNTTSWYRRLSKVTCNPTWINAAKSNVLKISVDTILPFAAATISGSSVICIGQENSSYSTASLANATSYIWTLPNGATGTSDSNSITVDFDITAVSGNITVKGINSCGVGASSSLAITINNMPANAGVISGVTTVCPGQIGLTYTIPEIVNATTYYWTLPNGTSGTSYTNSITVDVGTNVVAGNITVKGHSACGNGDSAILAITVNPLPLNAATITGATTVCQGQNAVTYTVPAITNATSYIWTLPNGATGTSSTNSITVDYGTSAISGNITVEGSNSCGSGVSSSLAITVNPLPITPVITQTGNTLTSNASNGNQWYNLTSGIITGSNAQTFNPVQIGNYFTIVTLNGCKSDSSNIIYYDNTGINENNSNQFSIHPNPATDKLTIDFQQLKNLQNTTISIYDIQGKLLLQQAIVQSQTELNITGFAKGVYVLKVSNEQKRMVSKFVKE